MAEGDFKSTELVGRWHGEQDARQFRVYAVFNGAEIPLEYLWEHDFRELFDQMQSGENGEQAPAE